MDRNAPFIYKYLAHANNPKGLLKTLAHVRLIRYDDYFYMRKTRTQKWDIGHVTDDELHQNLLPHMQRTIEAIDQGWILNELNDLLSWHLRNQYVDSHLILSGKNKGRVMLNPRVPQGAYLEDKIDVLHLVCPAASNEISFKAHRCEVCGSLYPYKLERSKYCSEECRNAHAYLTITKPKRQSHKVTCS